MSLQLTGSREALMGLFTTPRGLPHGVIFGLRGKARKEARQDRLHRRQWELRKEAAVRRLARYGLNVDERDVDVSGEVYGHRRRLRNARKQERRS